MSNSKLPYNASFLLRVISCIAMVLLMATLTSCKSTDPLPLTPIVQYEPVPIPVFWVPPPPEFTSIDVILAPLTALIGRHNVTAGEQELAKATVITSMKAELGKRDAYLDRLREFSARNPETAEEVSDIWREVYGPGAELIIPSD